MSPVIFLLKRVNNFPSHNNYSGAHLFNETAISLPVGEQDITQIITMIKTHDSVEIQLAEVVFVDKAEILRINQEYLNHNYVTDVITFLYNEQAEPNKIEGTLYCCAPQIKKQAKDNHQPEKKEFLRIIIHGLLHLCGYDDKTDADQHQMKQRENFYLSKLSLD